MGLDRVDVLFLHDAEDHFQAALHDGYPALAERRAQGVVIGAGMYHTANLTTLVRETDVDVVMLAGRYTLLTQRAPRRPAPRMRRTRRLRAGRRSLQLGVRSAEEVRRNLTSFRAAVPAQMWADLRGEGLLDQRAPVPV